MEVPPNHPLIDRIFDEINHLAIGVPPFMETPKWRLWSVVLLWINESKWFIYEYDDCFLNMMIVVVMVIIFLFLLVSLFFSK